MEDEGKASWRLRAALPLLVASNVALIAASHVCKGAATHVDGHAPLGTLTPHIASDDNLPSAVGKLWAARAYWMVFLVALLSGALPYLKLIATCGVVGLFDTGQLTAASAKTAFLILEVIGKYSFADVFLICLNCLIFDISTGGSYKILLFGSLELKLWVQLKFGAVALIVAITFSAFLTHWAAYEISPESHKEEGADEEEAPLLDTHEIRAGQNQLTAVQAASKPVETYNSFLQQWFSRATPSRLLLSLHVLVGDCRDGGANNLRWPSDDQSDSRWVPGQAYSSTRRQDSDDGNLLNNRKLAAFGQCAWSRRNSLLLCDVCASHVHCTNAGIDCTACNWLGHMHQSHLVPLLPVCGRLGSLLRMR